MPEVKKHPNKKDGKFSYRILMNGKRITKIGTNNRKETLLIAKQQQQFARDTENIINRKLFTQDLCHLLLIYLEEKKKTTGLQHFKYMKKALLKYFDALKLELISDLSNPSLIENTMNFLDNLKNENYKNPEPFSVCGKTKHAYLSFINNFFNSLVLDNYLLFNPIKKIFKKIKKTNKRTGYAFSIEEIKKIIEVSPQNHRIIYLIALFTGWRVGTLRALTKNNYIANENKLIHSKLINKTKVADEKYLPPKVNDLLKQYCDENIAEKLYKSAKVFDLNNKLIYIPKHVEKWVQDDLIKAGYGNLLNNDCGRVIGMHSWRHTFSSLLSSLGYNEFIVKKMMCHTTSDISSNYTHLSYEQKKEIIKKLYLAIWIHNEM